MEIRTIDKAYDELKKRDPETAISRYLVRQIVKQGKIPCIQAGNRKLIDVDVLADYVETVSKGIA